MRDVVVVFEVDDDKAIEKGLGTIDYLERELASLVDKGLSLQNARILDYDDEHDTKALVLVNRIFEEEN